MEIKSGLEEGDFLTLAFVIRFPNILTVPFILLKLLGEERHHDWNNLAGMTEHFPNFFFFFFGGRGGG